MCGRFSLGTPASTLATQCDLANLLAWTPRYSIAPMQPVGDPDTIVAISENATKLRIPLLDIEGLVVAHSTKAGPPFEEAARYYLDHMVGGQTMNVEALGFDRFRSTRGGP